MTAGDEFKQAWSHFGDECAATVAPEATYQAWFAHYLMEQFDVLRVVREVDFGSRYLVKGTEVGDSEGDQTKLPGSNLMLDVMLLRDSAVKANGSAPRVYLPRRSWLAEKDADDRHLRSGLERLASFEIISELKVGSTQGGGLNPNLILRDGHKLAAILRSAAALDPPIELPVPFVCVLDNNTAHPLGREYLLRRWERDLPTLRDSLLIFSIDRQAA